VLGLAAVWVALVIHPQPLFAYNLRRQNLQLHARAPLPPEAGPILDEAVRRLSRSPLHDPGQTYDVFLCGSSSLFTLFTLRTDITAATHPGGHAFIRAADVASNRVIDPSGHERTGERTLTYTIAHEATHAMTMAALGYLRFYRLDPFQVEGYADHVAFDHRLDLAAGREALRHDAPEMNPRRSGLYRRYELLVAYLLGRQGLSVQQLLARPLDRREIERRLEAEPEL
jgi:hypothetical protein